MDNKKSGSQGSGGDSVKGPSSNKKKTRARVDRTATTTRNKLRRVLKASGIQAATTYADARNAKSVIKTLLAEKDDSGRTYAFRLTCRLSGVMNRQAAKREMRRRDVEARRFGEEARKAAIIETAIAGDRAEYDSRSPHQSLE